MNKSARRYPLSKIICGCLFYILFHTGGYSSGDVEESGHKIMSARCILHGLHRSLSDTSSAEFFDPEYVHLVAHIVSVVEEETAQYSRPVDKKLAKIFTWPNALQSILFSCLALPGYDSYVLTRKVMIQEQIRNAIACDCEQFVFLGSGFDPEAVLRAQTEFSRKFYTIDLPESQAIMLTALRTYKRLFYGQELSERMDTRGNVTQICHNYYSISHDIESGKTFSMLCNFGFDPKKKTFVLMEGLTAYLNEQTVKLLLSDFKTFCPENSLALIGFIQKKIETSEEQRKAHEEANEQHKFTLSLAKIPEFMTDLGLHVEEMFTSRSACNLNVGSWAFNFYYGYWLSNELDENGIDPSTPEPYVLVKNTNQIMPIELQ